MPPRLARDEAVERLFSRPGGFLADALRPGRVGPTPYTNAVLFVVLWFFVLEVALTALAGAGRPYYLVSSLFVHDPWLVWPVAPFLHAGVAHVAANAFVVYLAGPVERRLDREQYLALLVASGFLPVYLDGAKLTLLGSEPHVAAYGASAFAFGLLGCAVVAAADADWRLTPREWVVVVLAIAGVAMVVENAIGAVGDPIAFNLGHLGGLLAGVALGAAWRRN